MTAVVAPEAPDDSRFVGRQMTRAEYDELVATGVLEGQPVELLEGEIVAMAPQGAPHSSSVARLTTRLARRLPESVLVSPQVPFAASDTSEPEPDVYLVDVDACTELDHPSWAHLVIEVAASSQHRDLVQKPRLYAGAGVPQYWVVDLPAREVVVHREPAGDRYDRVDRLPLDTPLDVLGVDVRLSDLLR